jgi:hypothetical protein
MTFLLNAETIKNNILIVSPSTTRINNKLYRRISVGSKNTPEFKKRLANAILLVSDISTNQSYLRDYIELENNIPSLKVKPKEIIFNNLGEFYLILILSSFSFLTNKLPLSTTIWRPKKTIVERYTLDFLLIILLDYAYTFQNISENKIEDYKILDILISKYNNHANYYQKKIDIHLENGKLKKSRILVNSENKGIPFIGELKFFSKERSLNNKITYNFEPLEHIFEYDQEYIFSNIALSNTDINIILEFISHYFSNYDNYKAEYIVLDFHSLPNTNFYKEYAPIFHDYIDDVEIIPRIDDITNDGLREIIHNIMDFEKVKEDIYLQTEKRVIGYIQEDENLNLEQATAQLHSTYEEMFKKYYNEEIEEFYFDNINTACEWYCFDYFTYYHRNEYNIFLENYLNEPTKNNYYALKLMEYLIYYRGNILVYNNNILQIFDNICSKNKLYGITTWVDQGIIPTNPFILSKF